MKYPKRIAVALLFAFYFSLYLAYHVGHARGQEYAESNTMATEAYGESMRMGEEWRHLLDAKVYEGSNVK